MSILIPSMRYFRHGLTPRTRCDKQEHKLTLAPSILLINRKKNEINHKLDGGLKQCKTKHRCYVVTCRLYVLNALRLTLHQLSLNKPCTHLRLHYRKPHTRRNTDWITTYSTWSWLSLSVSQSAVSLVRQPVSQSQSISPSSQLAGQSASQSVSLVS